MIRYAVTICVLHGHWCSTIVRIKRIIDSVPVCVGASQRYICQAIAVCIIAFDGVIDAVTI